MYTVDKERLHTHIYLSNSSELSAFPREYIHAPCLSLLYPTAVALIQTLHYMFQEPVFKGEALCKCIDGIPVKDHWEY